MEHYYFIQKGNTKQGPFKLAELKKSIIYSDELVWRSDDDQWKKASEFEELQDAFIFKPPLTPIEKKKKDVYENFIRTTLSVFLGIYILMSLLLSVTSFSIASKRWDDEKNKYIINKEAIGENIVDIKNEQLKSDKETLLYLRSQFKKIEPFVARIQNKKKNKSEIDSMNKYYYLLGEISRVQLDSTYQESVIEQHSGLYASSNNINVEPVFRIPKDIISLENINGLRQPYLFRPFYAFFSTIYLTRDEQENSRALFINLTLSSFALLFFIFIIIAAVYYTLKRTEIKSSL